MPSGNPVSGLHSVATGLLVMHLSNAKPHYYTCVEVGEGGDLHYVKVQISSYWVQLFLYNP